MLLADGGSGGIQSHKRRNSPATDNDDNTNKRERDGGQRRVFFLSRLVGIYFAPS